MGVVEQNICVLFVFLVGTIVRYGWELFARVQ